MTERNYYDILGLTPEADGTAVNRTYWLLARRYQGEATSDPRATNMLDELNEAYGVLGTPVLREAYDAAHPAAAEAGQSWSEQDPSCTRVRGIVPRRGSSRKSERVGRAAPDIHAFAPFAMAVALGAISFVAGLWSGSLLLAALGTCGALVVCAASMRHKIAGFARDVAARASNDGLESVVEPVVERGRPSDEPLSASIVPRRGVQADQLRISTASMVGRWRSSVRAAAGTETIDAERGPDSTLVDIFRSEQEVATPSEPLSAVLDVLRGSRRPG